MTAEPLTPEELAQARSWAARGLLEGLTHDEVARLVATVDALTAERDAERERADRNAELIGKHDPAGEDHLAEMMGAVAQRDAARSVIRHLSNHIVDADLFPPFSEWTAEEWEQSGWSDAEAAEIQAATQELG